MEQQIINLIENVRKFPVLYDKSHYKYSNKNYKAQIWRQVAENAGYKGKLIYYLLK